MALAFSLRKLEWIFFFIYRCVDWEIRSFLFTRCTGMNAYRQIAQIAIHRNFLFLLVVLVLSLHCSATSYIFLNMSTCVAFLTQHDTMVTEVIYLDFFSLSIMQIHVLMNIWHDATKSYCWLFLFFSLLPFHENIHDS